MDHSEYSGCEDCFPCECPLKGITANELDKTMYSVDVSQLLSPASLGLVQLAYEKVTVGRAGGVLIVQQCGLCLNKTDQTYAIAECLICQQQVQH